MSGKRKGKLYDVAILRVFCILVVVFFHCYQMMWAEAHFPLTITVYKDLYFKGVECGAISVAMPLFVFISGYLFYYLLMSGKYSTWRNLLQKKGLRILLPYVVFSLFFMITTDSWNLMSLLRGSFWHLWFLPMLFWCFIFGYGLYKVKLKVYMEVILITILFGGALISGFFLKWFGLSKINYWFYWFYLGMLCFKYRETIYFYLGKYKLSILLLLCSIAIIVLFPVEYGNVAWYINLAVTCCIVSLSCLMSGIDWSKYELTTPVVKFSAYSFGIYIWHNWVALMLISNTSKQLFGLPELAANHVVLFPLCFSLITLAISWTLSWMMMKTKVGKFLIG